MNPAPLISSSMRVIILGSAAGGGLPQWNCGCRNCQEARLSGTGRTQSSVAVSADGARWVLLNASPDLRVQVASRADAAGKKLGIACTAVPVARRPPRYARQAAAGTYDVGLRLTDERTGGTLAYVPAAGAVDDAVRSIAAGAGLLLFDGTFWSDDELAEAGGTDAPSAREMGHLPVGGPEGSMQLLPRAGAQRTVLVHINNTNPMLGRSSAERAEVEAAGLQVGEDGMEFEL